MMRLRNNLRTGFKEFIKVAEKTFFVNKELKCFEIGSVYNRRVGNPFSIH